MIGSSYSDSESIPGRKSTPTSVDDADSDSQLSFTLASTAMIPSLLRPKFFSPAEVALWSVDLVKSWSVVTIVPEDLVDCLEFPWGWFGPLYCDVDRSLR